MFDSSACFIFSRNLFIPAGAAPYAYACAWAEPSLVPRPGTICSRMRTIFRKISVKFSGFVSGRVSGISILRSILSVVCLLTKYTWRTEDGISFVWSVPHVRREKAFYGSFYWSHRLSELLCVPVREDDSFPDYICRSCRRIVESVESKLTYLKERIMDSTPFLPLQRPLADKYGHITEDYG